MARLLRRAYFAKIALAGNAPAPTAFGHITWFGTTSRRYASLTTTGCALADCESLNIYC